MPLEPEEQQNLLDTFGAVLEAVFTEKKALPQWKPKIDRADLKINLALQIAQDEYFYTHLIVDHGQMQFNKGQLDSYDLELLAVPEDLLFFSNATYSVMDMVLKKNEYGFPKLRVKKGIRNVGKLLFVSKLLVIERQ